MTSYDYVIVGGGSAGCVLANRLSADPGTRVLVLEAGRTDSWWDAYIHMPAAFSFPIGNPRYDWRYASEPEPFMDGRRVAHARGKVLGGSSSINGMIFQRGNALDYEKWAAEPGLERWSYAHCLPYFKRMETCVAGADDYRGDRGPLVLERGPATNELFGAFLEATTQAGYERTTDVNGYRQEGFGTFDRTIREGRRRSAARAYLHPVSHRPNLEIRCRVFVTRVLFEGTRAVGVEVSQTRRLRAHRSRRGDPLRRRDQLAAAPAAVGRRRSRAPALGRGRCRPRTTGRRREPPGPPRGVRPARVHEAVVRGAGDEVAEPAVGRFAVAPLPPRPRRDEPLRGGRVLRSNEEVAYPNLMFHFLPLAIRYDGTKPPTDHGYQVHVGPMNSDARGSVRITSRNPVVYPALRFNYLSTEQDRREWVEAIRCARHILGQPAFAEYDAGELSPGPEVETDEEILDWVARDAETALHPSCTCRMGIDADCGGRPEHAARARPGRPSRRRRVGDAVRDEREHLRARDDDRREGRRPDRRYASSRRRQRPSIVTNRRADEGISARRDRVAD